MGKTEVGRLDVQGVVDSDLASAAIALNLSLQRWLFSFNT